MQRPETNVQYGMKVAFPDLFVWGWFLTKHPNQMAKTVSWRFFVHGLYTISYFRSIFGKNFLVVDSHFSFQALFLTFSPVGEVTFFYVTFFPSERVFSSNNFWWIKTLRKTPPSKFFSDFCVEKITQKKHHFAYKKMIFQKHPTNPGNKRFHGTGWKIFSVMVVRKIKSDGSAKNCDFLLTRFFPMVKKDSLPTIRF